MIHEAHVITGSCTTATMHSATQVSTAIHSILLCLAAAFTTPAAYIDTTPPAIRAIEAHTVNNRVIVSFDDTLDAASAQTAANYTVHQKLTSLTVTSASLGTDRMGVTLTLASP